MPTTIRLPENLKQRVSAAAERTGATPQDFILEAIAEKTAQAECCNEFEAEVETRYERIIASGKIISWPEMRRYLEVRVSGKAAQPPSPQMLSATVAARLLRLTVEAADHPSPG